MKLQKMLIPTAMALAAMACIQPANATDLKIHSVGGCAPYTTGTPNYNLLRFRPESIQNQSNGYLYVICPLSKDAETSWNDSDPASAASIHAYFRTNTAGNFQCTLTIGSNYNNAIWTDTQSVSGEPGQLLNLTWSNIGPGLLNAPATLVCRLPPKGSMVSYWTTENAATD